jgi:peroxiredoxin Q/BCP
MRRSIRLAVALLPLAAATPAVLHAQTAAATAAAPAPAAPEVGAPAPDFTMPAVGANGQAAPVSLAAMRGKVVVLAFYPKDKTSGCTAELQKFRDEYAALFPGADRGDVVVVPVSADGLASHAAWAGEAKFPFALASDSTLGVAERYGSRTAGRPFSNRTVFVIGRDGTVKYRDLRFNALSEEAYANLAAAVKAARG